MASIDHTARLRLLVRNEPKSKFTSSVDDPLRPAGAGRERRLSYESERASTALAVAVMEGILKSHRTFQQAHPERKGMGLLPLNPVQVIGLEAAIDLLHHYVDTLTPEQGG